MSEYYTLYKDSSEKVKGYLKDISCKLTIVRFFLHLKNE